MISSVYMLQARASSGCVQVAEPIPLVDVEGIIVIPLGDDIADVIVERLDVGMNSTMCSFAPRPESVELHHHPGCPCQRSPG